MSDTPIFDQLAAERGYSRMIAGDTPAYRGLVFAKPGIMAPGAYVNAWQTDENVNAAPTEEDDVIVYRKPIPVTTLADLAEGKHQE